jgi:hypothetical protein
MPRTCCRASTTGAGTVEPPVIRQLQASGYKLVYDAPVMGDFYLAPRQASGGVGNAS